MGNKIFYFVKFDKFQLKMAKSKNHTAHNQGYKNHRNGIRRPKKQRTESLKMVNQKYVRNLRRAKKFDESIKKSKNVTAKIALRRTMKAKVLAAIKEKRNNRALGIKPAKKEVTKKR